VQLTPNYNLWFVDGGQLPPGSVRRYHVDVDWVYYQAGTVLSPQQVVAQVASPSQRTRRGAAVSAGHHGSQANEVSP
jgi:hypothetical protein